MPKTVFSSWVKNVHKLRIQRRETQGQVSTQASLATHNTPLPANKLLVIPSLVHGFYPQLFTAKKSQFNLLVRHLYPLSTWPTINTKKEN